MIAVDEAASTPAPRGVLLAVTGLSPQGVNETIYALWKRDPLLVPTEMHLSTTALANLTERAAQDDELRALIECLPPGVPT